MDRDSFVSPLNTYSARAAQAALGVLAAILMIAALGEIRRAEAATRALVIAASDYANHSDLEAAGQDAEGFLRFLRESFVDAEVTVISDAHPDVSQAIAPTRANMLSALEKLGSEAREGDFVVLYYSGHGTQVPDGDGDEVDGRDEALVPTDAPRDDLDDGNVLTDDRIAGLLDKVLGRGANAWIIIDSCFSGTATRAVADPSISVKGIVGAQGYGNRLIGKDENILDGATASSKRGKFAAFFASQSYQKSIMREGVGSVFTWSLLEALRLNEGISYRQLIEIVRKKMSIAGERQIPFAIGDLLDDSLPVASGGKSGATGSSWWPISTKGAKLYVESGFLSGLESGTRLSLHRTAALEEEGVQAEIKTVGAVRSLLRVCKEQEGSPADCGEGGEVADAGQFEYASLVAPGISNEVRLFLRNVRPDQQSRELARVRQALAAIDWSRARLAVKVEDEGCTIERCDYVLIVESGRLYFADPGIRADDPVEGRFPSVGLSESDLADAIMQKLTNIWFLQRLRKLADVVESGPENQRWIKLEVEYDRADIAEGDWPKISGQGYPDNPSQYGAICQHDRRRAASAAKVTPGTILTDCDRIAIRAWNNSSKRLRIRVVHYDSRGCVEQIYPHKDTDAGKSEQDQDGILEPNNVSQSGKVVTRDKPLFVLTRDLWQSPPPIILGQQGIIAFAVVDTGHDPFRSLRIQDCSLSLQRNLAVNEAGLASILNDLFPATTRGELRKWESDKLAILHRQWTVEEYPALMGQDNP